MTGGSVEQTTTSVHGADEAGEGVGVWRHGVREGVLLTRRLERSKDGGEVSEEEWTEGRYRFKLLSADDRT